MSFDLKPLPNVDEKKDIFQRKFIRGIVIDQASQRPMPFALVQVLGSDLNVYTDFDGKFELSLFLTEEDKSRTVRITYLGYVQIEQEILAVEHIHKPFPVFEMKINTNEIVYYLQVGDTDPTPARKTGIWPQFNTFYLSKKRIWKSEPDQ